MRGDSGRPDRSRARYPSTLAKYALLALTASSGLSCEDSVGVSRAEPGTLRAEPSTIDFGRLFESQIGESNLLLRLTGGRDTAFQARFVGSAPGFVLLGADGELRAGRSLEVQVFHRANSSGPIEATLEFIPTDPEINVASVRLLADGVPIPDCEDGNGCTIDSFDETRGACRHEAARLPCDDFNGCTVQDFCVEGVCLGAGTSCDDGDICTDDLCDPRQGCLHPMRSDCDDGNPCTADSCDPVFGCRNVTLDDGTPCSDDQEICTRADICIRGSCVGVQIEDGTTCDDGDPCSDNDQCISGVCRDPDYQPPGPGDIKFEYLTGPLAPGSERNPLLLPSGDVVVGIQGGVIAVTECGTFSWTSSVGTPRFSAALALPGIVSVPVGAEILDLAQDDGTPLARIDVERALPTSTLDGPTTTRIVDMAARASGALVVSVERADGESFEGYLAEVDAAHQVVTILGRFGPRVARRIALDRNESIVLILREGRPDSGIAPEQVVRLGIDGLAGGTWSTGPIDTLESELALGATGEVLWTAGLVRISQDGQLSTLRSPAAIVQQRRQGAPIVFGPWVWSQDLDVSGTGGRLVARTSTGSVERAIPIQQMAPVAAPVVDSRGNIFIVDAQGVLRGFSADEQALFATELRPPQPVREAALGLAPDGLLVVPIGNRVYGVQGFAGLAVSPWPRNRRDNFGTGHR